MALGIEESIVRTQGGTTEVSRLAGDSVCFPWIQADGWTSCVFPARREGRRDCDSHRDGIIAGPPAQMAEINQILQGKVSMKDMGSIDKHGKKYLGKIIKRTARGFTIQADPEFYDRLLEETGLDQRVSSPTPGTNAMKPTAEWEKEAWDEDLDRDSHKHYRKIVGMLRISWQRDQTSCST